MLYRRTVLTFMVVIVIITSASYLGGTVHYTIIGQEGAKATNTTNYNATISTITVISTIYSTVTTTIGFYHTITYTTILTLNWGVAPEIAIVIVMVCTIIALIIGYIIGLKIHREEYRRLKEEAAKRAKTKRR